MGGASEMNDLGVTNCVLCITYYVLGNVKVSIIIALSCHVGECRYSVKLLIESMLKMLDSGIRRNYDGVDRNDEVKGEDLLVFT